jgi:hypothetical protein
MEPPVVAGAAAAAAAQQQRQLDSSGTEVLLKTEMAFHMLAAGRHSK